MSQIACRELLRAHHHRGPVPGKRAQGAKFVILLPAT
jgi:hypothetical protein